MELAIDTSTRYASVAISREGDAVGELTWRSEQNHSVELAPAINDLLRRAGVTMDDLTLVIVARGPGGFSALRVGLSTAKTLALALELPLVSVGTLDVEAQPYLSLGIDVCALIGAGRQRVYLGRFQESGQGSEPLYKVLEHDDLVSAIHGPTLFCGDGVPDVAERLRTQLGDGARLADVRPPTRRASVMAFMGFRRWQESGGEDLAGLQPLYLRSAQINMARRTWAKTR